MDGELLGIIPAGDVGFDPFDVSVWVGIVAAFLAAIILRASWSRLVKAWVTVGLVVVLTIFVWWMSAYPATWQLLAAIFAQIYAASQIVFYALKPTGILEWLRDVTSPGYTAQHAAGETKE